MVATTNAVRELWVGKRFRFSTRGEMAMKCFAEPVRVFDVASENPAITPDGRFVAFWSSASDVVPGDTNGAEDVFVFDRQNSAVRAGERGQRGAPGQ